jgi:hypothetical protein
LDRTGRSGGFADKRGEIEDATSEEEGVASFDAVIGLGHGDEAIDPAGGGIEDMGTFDGHKIDPVALPKVEFDERPPHDGDGGVDLDEAEAIGELEELPDVRDREALDHVAGGFLFGVEHLVGADGFEDTAVVIVGGTGDDAFDAELGGMNDDEHLGFEVGADGGHEDIDIGDPLGFEGLALRGVEADGKGDLVLDGVETFHVAVDGDDLGARAGESEGGCLSEVTESDDGAFHKWAGRGMGSSRRRDLLRGRCNGC